MSPRPLHLVVDGAAFGLSPYGGLITFWTQLLNALVGLGVVVDLIPPTRPRSSLPASWLQPRIPDHAHTAVTSTYYTAEPPRLGPEFVVLHDLIYETNRTLIGATADDPNVLRAKRQALERAAAVVCPSRSTAQAAAVEYPEVPITAVVPHGVHENFQPHPRSTTDRLRDSVLAAHDVTSPFLLFVGGRQDYKRFDTALLLTERLQRRNPSIKLVSVGSQPFPLPLEQGVIPPSLDGPVIFLGKVDPAVLASLYRSARAVVCPSVSEGFGLVPPEAACCGAVLICSDIEPHRATVSGYAELFPPDDILAAEAAFERAIRTTRITRIERAERVRSQHSWSATARAYRDILYDIALPKHDHRT